MAREDAAPSAGGHSLGLLAAVRRLLASLTAVLHTRAQLLFTEVEEEAGRIFELLLYELVAVFFLGMGLLLATLFVVILFWDDHRMAVLGGFTVLYFGIGGAAAYMVYHKLRHRPRLFAASLAELNKDCERLDQAQ